MSQAIAFKKSESAPSVGKGHASRSGSDEEQEEDAYEGVTLASSYMPAGSMRPGRPMGTQQQPNRHQDNSKRLSNSGIAVTGGDGLAINDDGAMQQGNGSLSGSHHYDRHGQLKGESTYMHNSTPASAIHRDGQPPRSPTVASTQSPKLANQRAPSGMSNHSIVSQPPASSISLEPLRFKIVVVGDYSVGKSSLIRQLTQRVFSLQSMATIGVEFKEFHSFIAASGTNSGLQRQASSSAISTAGGNPSPTRGSSNHSLAAAHAPQQPVTAQIWDIAGQQYCSSMTKQYYRGSSCAVVVADVARPSAFDVTLEWRDDFLGKAGTDALQSSAEMLEKMGAKNPAGKSGIASRILSRSTNNANASGSSTASPSPSSPNTDYQLTQEEVELFRLPVFLIGNKADLLPATARGPFGGSGAALLGHGNQAAASSNTMTESAESSPRMGAGSMSEEPFVSERGVHEFAKQKNFDDSFVVSAKDYDSVSHAFHTIIRQLAERRVNQEAHKAALCAANNNLSPKGRARGESVMLHNRNKKDEPVRQKKKKDCEC